jgi:D-inositol-3-phosphate glycosyltransferase
MDKLQLLVIADTPTISTGFGTVSENVLLNLPQNDWDIHILGINYLGDPHHYQSRWKIYPTGDTYGAGRIKTLLENIKPHCIWILNDTWVAAKYIQAIKQVDKNVPIVVYTPVDAPGTKPEFVLPLNAATHVVTYTHWAQQELIKAGLTVASSVIAHGVNRQLFYPVDKTEARKQLFNGVTELQGKTPFIVLYNGRNQMRKRVDLFVYIMLKWIKEYDHDDVYFHYHGAPKGDMGNDIEYLSDYFTKELDVPYQKRLIFTSHELSSRKHLPVEKMKIVYSGADLYFHTCAIEGFGLPIAEAMACGVPTLVPNYSALADWPKGAVRYMEVDPTPWANPQDIDTIHRFVDVNDAIQQLEMLYQQKTLRDELGKRAYDHMTHERFDWKYIGSQFDQLFKAAKEQKQWQLKTLV